MDEHTLANVARFLATAAPVAEKSSWYEKRLALRYRGQVYPIQSNLNGIVPGWDKVSGGPGRINGGGWTKIGRAHV